MDKSTGFGLQQQAIERAKEKIHSGDLVLASDAFFPFRDVVDFCAKEGITAIVQPGGSVKDADSIAAANEHEHPNDVHRNETFLALKIIEIK